VLVQQEQQLALVSKKTTVAIPFFLRLLQQVVAVGLRLVTPQHPAKTVVQAVEEEVQMDFLLVAG
jgi:hypothetical protein